MRILVPLDGSEAAETALPIALRLAQKPGDSIVLVSAVSRRRREPPAPAEPDVASVADAQAYLGAVKSHLCPSHVRVETAVWLGLPAAAIVRAAAVMRRALATGRSCRSVATRSHAWDSSFRSTSRILCTLGLVSRLHIAGPSQ